MLGILTRTMAGELLKTILLTTAVLVSVIAFGAAIKPLARNLLGGTDILRYVALAAVPMLQYALPFSAGFGATLVMHRLATDKPSFGVFASLGLDAIAGGKGRRADADRQRRGQPFGMTHGSGSSLVQREVGRERFARPVKSR